MIGESPPVTIVSAPLITVPFLSLLDRFDFSLGSDCAVESESFTAHSSE